MAASRWGTAPNGPGYTGHVNDPESGLVYMQQRYYDPVVGRFLSTDPVVPSPGELFAFNRYDYTNNNPVNRTDPDGRCPTCIVVGEVAAAMVAGAVVGAGTDYLVQKAFNPHQPVNKNEVVMSAVVGSVSGGTDAIGGALIRAGTMSMGKAVATTVLVNGAAGAAGRVEQGKLDGTPATNTQIATAAVGNMVGTSAAKGIGYIAHDLSQAASEGAAVNMSKAAANSPAGIGATITDTTAAVGIGAKQSATTATLSQTGQAAAQLAGSAAQEKIDQHN